jgi:predicted Fe-Mo cluster-binding NifX family protein
MIVLIPTNDGLTIAPELNMANAFRCLNITNGAVKEDIIREIKNESLEGFIDAVEKDARFYDYAAGKIHLSAGEGTELIQNGIVITSAISSEAKERLQKHKFEIMLSRESNIINAILDYIKHYAPTESDYCCCP